MVTRVICDGCGGVWLVPDETLEHSGFGAWGSGHTDKRRASGSVFVEGLDPTDLFCRLASGAGVSSDGALFQAEHDKSVGFSALLDEGSEFGFTGVIIKTEAPAGSAVASAVIAPAKACGGFGTTVGLTALFGAVAVPTDSKEWLPADVAEDAEVLAAMEAGALRTFVTVFPGRALSSTGRSLPRTSEIGVLGMMAFLSDPENEGYVALPGLSDDAVTGLCVAFNKDSMEKNRPAPDSARDLVLGFARDGGWTEAGGLGSRRGSFKAA